METDSPRHPDEASADIDASPQQVWDLVTDITQMGRWSPECTGGKWLDGTSGPTAGARFKGTNKRGPVRWSTKSKITVAEEPSHFEWEVEESGMRWGYRFDGLPDGGTRVTEYRRKTREVSLPVKLVQKSGLIGRNREQLMVEGMHETLRRVRAAAEAG